MKRGTIMSLEGRTAIVLTPDGQFVRVRRRPQFDIGDEVGIEASERSFVSRRRVRLWQSGALASAVLIALFAVVLFRTPPVVAYVSLDVNPSLEIGLDAGERVRELRAVNEDATSIVAGIEYRGKPIESVMNELARKLIEQRALTPEDGGVMIASVPVKKVDEQWERELTRKMVRILDDAARADDAAPDVRLEVTALSVPAEVRQEAEANGISAGKMAFWLVSESQGHEISPETIRNESMQDIASPWGGVKQVMSEYDKVPAGRNGDADDGENGNKASGDGKKGANGNNAGHANPGRKPASEPKAGGTGNKGDSNGKSGNNKGSNDNKGNKGNNGDIGNKGNSGKKGDNGKKSDNDNKGNNGKKGNSGNNGHDGNKGNNGNNGDKANNGKGDTGKTNAGKSGKNGKNEKDEGKKSESKSAGRPSFDKDNGRKGGDFDGNRDRSPRSNEREAREKGRDSSSEAERKDDRGRASDKAKGRGSKAKPESDKGLSKLLKERKQRGGNEKNRD
ncbi:anti-sigma factor domain-containing protein [Paenibacillaceae bacterium WGS1546]|uniref:anti-sigma factor domain-containing protein n=1 Tax=Cohnella sp. WGS1546 TaxID=3366810 RepID=UPI00372D0898